MSDDIRDGSGPLRHFRMGRRTVLQSLATGVGAAVFASRAAAQHVHTVAAAAFIFLLQRYALSATLESSLLWALTFGGCAAGLAYMQSNR